MDDCINTDKKAEKKMLKAENQIHIVRKTSVVWRRQKYHHGKYLSILKYLFHKCMQCSNINTPLIQTKYTAKCSEVIEANFVVEKNLLFLETRQIFPFSYVVGGWKLCDRYISGPGSLPCQKMKITGHSFDLSCS